MRRYERDAGNDAELVQQLIAWNLEMSAAMHKSLHLFEVLLRNAMNDQLLTWNNAQGYSTAWLLTPDPRLAKLLSSKTLQDARFRAQKIAAAAGRAPTHDDVLAQMTMGTWRYLLPSHASAGKRRLWEDALVLAFPHWYGSWEPLVRRVEIVYDLRNRVAHLEPLHRSPLRAVRRSMREIVGAMGGDAAPVFKRFDTTLPLIDANPLAGGATN